MWMYKHGWCLTSFFQTKIKCDSIRKSSGVRVFKWSDLSWNFWGILWCTQNPFTRRNDVIQTQTLRRWNPIGQPHTNSLLLSCINRCILSFDLELYTPQTAVNLILQVILKENNFNSFKQFSTFREKRTCGFTVSLPSTFNSAIITTSHLGCCC